MSHPFKLKIEELKAINFSMEEISHEAAAKIVGGGSDDPIITIPDPKSENGGNPTTLRVGEEGGATTEAIGEEGGSDFDI